MKLLSLQNATHCRVYGYLVTILMHSINTVVMLQNFRGDVLKDPDIQVFYYFIDKFITCWTFTLQSIHAVLGLTCELLILLSNKEKENRLLELVKYVKNTLFVCIVVPYSLTISTAFWPIFLYNRELILPAFTTKIVGTISNHVMHSAIVPATLWEMCYNPQRRPENHRLNVTIIMSYTLLYLAVIFISYFKVGLFPYPLLDLLIGSASFPALLALMTVWVLVCYYLQWHIYDTVNRQASDKKVC